MVKQTKVCCPAMVVMKKIILILLLFVVCSSFLHSGESKKACIFIDPQITDWKKYFYSPLGLEETNRYQQLGFEVHQESATVENIVHALLDPTVKAITFIGINPLDSASVTGIGKPTLGGLTRKQWQETVRTELQKRYISDGLYPEEALQKTEEKSQNFGLEMVTNYSSHSLANTTIADLFVKPGGTYFGAITKYSESDLYSFLERNDVSLTEYKRLVKEVEVVDIELPEDGIPESQIPSEETPETLTLDFNAEIYGDGPSWGSSLPSSNDKPAIFDLVFPQLRDSIPCYDDQGVIWLWTGTWSRFLKVEEGAFLEYNISNPNQPIAKYERNIGENERFIEIRLEDKRPKWPGKRIDLTTNEASHWHLIWR